MNKDKTVEYWLTEAKEDWRVARSLFEKKHYRYCLFFVHLHLEKRLKAETVAATGKQAPFTHDLVALARKSRLAVSQEEEAFLDRLTRYNRLSRYPEILESKRSRLTKNECAQEMAAARRFLRWLSCQRQS